MDTRRKTKDQISKELLRAQERIKKLEKEKSEDLYRNLIEHSLQGIVIIQDNSIVFANQVVSEITGFAIDELQSLSPEQVRGIIHPEDQVEVWNRLRERMEGKQVLSRYVIRVKHKDEGYIWLELYVRRIDYKGKPAIQASMINISDRKEAEQTLHHTEEMYSAVTETSPDAITMIDLQGIIKYASRQTSKLHRVKNNVDLIGRNSKDFIVPEEQEKAQGNFEKAARGSIIRDVEYTLVRDDGTCFPGTISASMIKDDQGNPTGFIAITRDITEQKKAETELRKREATLNSIFRAAPTGIGLAVERVMIQVNDRICDMVGYTKEELLGKNGRFLYPSDEEYQFVGEEKYRQIKEKGTGTVETQWLRKDGDIIDVLLSSTPLDLNDLSVGVTFTALDITERKKTLEALKQSEEQFRYLAEQSPNMIFINKQGKVVYANKQSEEMMGYKIQEFLASDFNFMDLIAPESLQVSKQNFAEHQKNRDVVPYEYSLITKNKKKIDVIITTKLIPYEDETAILGIVTDITERKQAEDKIKASLHEKDVMLREIHHRVKNNLQIITSLLRLQSAHIEDENILKFLQLSQNRIKTMSLIHESLYKSKDLSQINLSDYIRNMTSHLFSVYNQEAVKVNIKLNLEDALLDINTAIPFGLILNELVTNSLKHAFPDEKEGDIFIELRQTKTGKVMFRFGDTGIGIPEEIDFNNPVTLGLQLINDLVWQLNGTIQIDPREGTFFRIEF